MEANVFEDLLKVLAEEHSIDPYRVGAGRPASFEGAG